MFLFGCSEGMSNLPKPLEDASARMLSIQTYMELLQGAQNKGQHVYIKDFLTEYNFEILSLTENIGHRAAIILKNIAYLLVSGQEMLLLRRRQQNIIWN